MIDCWNKKEYNPIYDVRTSNVKGLKTVYVDSSNDNIDKNATVIEDDNNAIMYTCMQWIMVTVLWVRKPFCCWAVRESETELCLYLRRFAMQMTVIKQCKPVPFI
jgi:hypothetical protein